jgi:hypothetical protein
MNEKKPLPLADLIRDEIDNQHFIPIKIRDSLIGIVTTFDHVVNREPIEIKDESSPKDPSLK